MTGTRILWGQMALSLTAILTGLWGATEWTAMRLGFHPALGPAWFLAAGVPVYQPYLFFAWWYHFDAYAPGIFLDGAAWPRRAVSWPLSLRLSVRCVAHSSQRWSRPMARRAGRRNRRCAKGDCWSRPESISAASASSTSGPPAPSTSCALRRRAAARASVWSCRRSSPGLAARQRDTANPEIVDQGANLFDTAKQVRVDALWRTGLFKQSGEGQRTLRHRRRMFEHHDVARDKLRAGHSGKLVIGEIPGLDRNQHADQLDDHDRTWCFRQGLRLQIFFGAIGVVLEDRR